MWLQFSVCSRPCCYDPCVYILVKNSSQIHKQNWTKHAHYYTYFKTMLRNFSLWLKKARPALQTVLLYEM